MGFSLPSLRVRSREQLLQRRGLWSLRVLTASVKIRRIRRTHSGGWHPGFSWWMGLGRVLLLSLGLGRFQRSSPDPKVDSAFAAVFRSPVSKSHQESRPPGGSLSVALGFPVPTLRARRVVSVNLPTRGERAERARRAANGASCSAGTSGGWITGRRCKARRSSCRLLITCPVPVSGITPMSDCETFFRPAC